MEDLMMRDELEAAFRGLDKYIDAYAEVLVSQGLNVKEGQEVVIKAPVEAYDFVRRVVDKAYKAGAGHVTLMYRDDEVSRMTYDACDESFFEKIPEYERLKMDTLAENGACFLFLTGRDPSVFEHVDPSKIAKEALAYNSSCKAYRKGLDMGLNVWCIAGVPQEGWAKKVFPDASVEEAMYRLWRSILYVSRVLDDDPDEAWQTHNAAFKKNLRFLNEKKFDSLRYTSSNGTNFVIGLPEGHIWEGGAAYTVDGHRFFPNIPTEEVFTTPDRLRCDGVVHSALPLVHQGSIIKDFWIEFKEGKVVNFDAQQGREQLRQIIETAKNADRLGEVALVSKNTPIRESGILFYETLYDENASCHLALGKGFPECMEGGLEMTSEQLEKAGVNQSHTHVDFMIGSDDLTITGLDKEGNETRIFVNGQWVWE